MKDFVKAVEARAVGAEVMESLVPSQQIIKIVNEELTALMGGSCELITTPVISKSSLKEDATLTAS